jgi:VCBS repeat-containing protein
VLANDTDADGGPKSIASVTQPTNGTVAITGGGTGLTYQPNANYCNTPPGTTLDTFTYTLTPGGSTAIVSVTVTCVDDAPVAVDDSATVAEDSAATAINVLANDTDVDAGPKSITSVTQPTNGTVVVTGGGTGLTYQPDVNYCNSQSGGTPDTFTYTLTPGGSSATVSVTVTCVNDDPFAVNDSATVTEDAAATAIDVLANDTDPENDSFTIDSVTQPTNGAVVITGGGTGLTYQPNANYCNTPPGTTLDTFTYTLSPGGSTATVSVTVTCVDDAPVAVNDSATVLEDAAASAINVLANDTDVDGGPKSINTVTQPANGTVVVTSGGTGLTYQPNVNYCNSQSGGTADTFTYTLTPGGSSATVSVTVTCVNDAPVAVNDSVSVLEDGSLTVNAASGVLANDTDVDNSSLTAILVTGPAHSASFALNADGSFSYAPAANYFGSDSFTYKANDGTADSNVATVSITVTPVNDAPSFTKGADQTVNEDAGAQTVATWATAISAGPNESGQTVSFIIDNNSNPSLFSAGPAVASNGTLTYTPAANQNGVATITLHAKDDGGTTNGGVDSSATQTFVITVNAVNDAPTVTAPAAFAIHANMKRTGLTGLLANVTDVDSGVNGCSPTFTATNVSATTPAGGTISNLSASTGTFDFDPPPGFTGGPVTFTYTVTDNGCPGTATSAPATVTFNVSGPVIWFVNPAALTNGDGRLSGPFNSLASATTAKGTSANHRIFVYSGTTASGVGVTLTGDTAQATAQWLIGQGVTGTDFDSVMGITPPANTIARPSIGGTRPTIQGTVTLGTNTVVKGLNISSSTAIGLADTAGAITGVSVDQVAVTTTTGTGVNLSDIAGTLTFTGLTTSGGTGANLTGSNSGATFNFTGVSVSSGTNDAFVATGGGTLNVTGSNNTLTRSGGTTNVALNVSNTTIGASGLTFLSISANGGATGIVLNTTGSSGGLTVTGTGSTDGTGGTIQNTTTRGASFTSAQNITLKNMNFTNAATTQSATNCANLSLGGNSNLGCNAPIHLDTITNATLDNLNINGSAQQGINGRNVTGFVLSNSTITGIGNAADEDGIHFLNMLGTSSIANTSISGSFDDNLIVQNLSGTTNLTISGSTFTNSTQGSGILFGIRGTSNSTITISGATQSTTNFSGGIVADAFENSTMNLTVTGSTSSGNNDQLSVSAGDNSNVDLNVNNNTLSSVAVADFVVVSLLGSALDNGFTFDARIQNNNITVANGLAADGITINNAGGGAMNTVISGNTFDYAGSQRAILLQSGTDGAGALNATVTGNNIDIKLDGANNAVAGILAQASVTSPQGDGASICADTGGAGALSNTFTHSLGGSLAAGDIRVRQRNNGTMRLPGYGGGATDTAAVIAYLNGRNAEVSPSTATADSTGFAGGGACTQPNP